MKRTVLFFLLMVACCPSAFAGLIVCIEEDELGTLWSQPYDSETTSFLTTDDTTTAFWSLTFDADPYVESSVSLTNKTSSAKIYTVTFTVDLEEAITPTSLYGGWVSGSLTAGPGGGHLYTVSSAPLYWGMIDGTGVLPFYPPPPDPCSWTGNATIALRSSGLPGPTLPYESVMSSISIQHKFKLGAGDTVTLNGYFEVVPEPATICLLGLGVLGLLRRKKQ